MILCHLRISLRESKRRCLRWGRLPQTKAPKNQWKITVILLLCFLQNEYMKDDFFIKIETWHKPDLGTLENVSFNSGLSVQKPGNGNTVVHFVMDRPFVTRVIYLRPTWTYRGAFNCGEAGKQPATDGLSLSAPLLWCESGLVRLPFFIWVRESRDKIHRSSPNRF